MELRERINRILQACYNSKKSHYDVTDEILSEIGNCGECRHRFHGKDCPMKNRAFIRPTDFCSDFERREK